MVVASLATMTWSASLFTTAGGQGNPLYLPGCGRASGPGLVTGGHRSTGTEAGDSIIAYTLPRYLGDV